MAHSMRVLLDEEPPLVELCVEELVSKAVGCIIDHLVPGYTEEYDHKLLKLTNLILVIMSCAHTAH